jgi:uncharacterized protein YndB with AHSA1/START domain
MPEETQAATSVSEHEVRIAARPETVFAYFTDPARMVQWMGVEATLDPRPGGICQITFRTAESALDGMAALLGVTRPQAIAEPTLWVMSGRFVEVDPPRRIALTWGWEEDVIGVPPESTAVDVSFVPDGEGTVLRLVHRRLSEARTAFIRTGWEHYLARLAAAAAGQATPDPWQAAEE